MKDSNKAKLIDKIKNILTDDKLIVDVPEYKVEDVRADELYLLFLKTLRPEAFCTECDSQLFIGENGYECMNCGFKPKNKVVASKESSEPAKVDSEANKNKNVPENVERMAQEADKVAKSAASSSRAEQIRKAAEKIKSGDVAPPTDLDDSIVKQATGSMNVNWVD